MIDNMKEITADRLLAAVYEMAHDSCRFVTATCVDNGDDSLDMIYSFDKGDMELRNFRMKISKSDQVPSISKIYFCAVLVENEIKELFGVDIRDMAIDYQGHLLLSEGAPDTPMLRRQIEVVRKNAGAGGPEAKGAAKNSDVPKGGGSDA